MAATCQYAARSTARAVSSSQRCATRALSTCAPRYKDISRTRETEEIPATFELEDLSSMAHTQLQAHRELRSLARLAAWEMPLLSSLSKRFEPPTLATPLRWRYTTYMGELHPAAHKVVVEFSLHDLKDLDEAQKQTLRKLAGPRWSPETDIIKMSCESFESQAQNKRYLGETIAALITEAKEGADKFKDVPLDLRHAEARAKRRLKRSPGVKFPVEWRMTPERKAKLDAKHRRSQQIPEPVQPQVEAPQGQITPEQALETVRRAAMAAGELPQESSGSSSSNVISGTAAIQAAQRAEAGRLAAQPVDVFAEVPRRRRR